MRVALATLALAAASASASKLFGRQTIPTCATTCITNANLGGCSATDDACLCKSTTFITSAATCIESSCTGADLAAAISAAEQLCAAVGVTLSNLPTGSATTAAATGASSAASGSAPATTATSPATASVSKAASTYSSAASTKASSTSSSAPAASSSKSAGSIVGVNAFAGMAAFGLAALAL